MVGFGGPLQRGDLYAVILFSRRPLSKSVALRIRSLALDVTTAFFRYGGDEVFDAEPNAGEAATFRPQPRS